MKKKVRLLTALLLGIEIVAGAIFVPLTVEANSNVQISGTIEVAMHKSESMIEPYIKAFNRKYPNVKVTYTTYEDYESSMAKRVEENNLPDVFFIPGSITYEKYTDYLLPLGTIENMKKNYNYMEKGCYQGDTCYGIPSFAYLYGFIYNKNVFANAGISEIPTTIDDFIEACELIKTHTNAIPFYCNHGDTWSLGYWEMYPFIEMNGTNSFRYTTFLNTKNPFSEGSTHYEVYKLLYNLVANGYVEDFESSGYGEGSDMLAHGEVGAMSMGSWAFEEIQSYDGADELGFMPFPTNVDGQQYCTVGIDYCYGISKNTMYKSASEAFVKFMLEESGYAYDTGNISIVRGDSLPEYLNELSDVVMLYDSYAGQIDYQLILALQTYFYPGEEKEVVRIMDSAAGISGESFDDIIDDWNARWEKGRPEGYVTTVSDDYDRSVLETNSRSVEISRVEEKYLESRNKLKIGYLEDTVPFSYEKDGEFAGLNRDICERIEELINLKFEYVAFSSINEITDALDNEDIDLAIGIYKNSISGLKYSKAYYDALEVYVTKKGVDISDLSSLKVANGDTVEECLQQVKNGDVDYYIENFYSADYYLQSIEYLGLEISPTSNEKQIAFAYSENVDNTLVALINKCLYVLPDEELQVMLFSHLKNDSDMTIAVFIKQNPILFVVFISGFGVLIILGILVVTFHVARTNYVQKFEMEKFQMLSALSDEYFFDIDVHTMSINFEKKFRDTFGFPDHVDLSKYHDEKEHVRGFIEKVYGAVRGVEVSPEPIVLNKVESGEAVFFRILVSTMKDETEKIVYVVGKMQNIQSEMEVRNNAKKEALTDPLTKIFNRRGFDQMVPEVSNRSLFVVMDCDNFKGVNDTLGHPGGDAVLVLMGEELTRIMGEVGVVGRHGGDEFVAMVPELDYEEATKLLDELTRSMDRDFEYGGIVHHISISAGAAYFEFNTPVETMFTYADDVLYEKKKNGKNGYMIRKM